MQITNRTQTVYTWIVWNLGDTMYWSSLGCEWIHPGQTHTLNVPGAAFKLYHFPGQWDAVGMSKFGNSAKVINNPNANILIQGDFAPGGYVDFDVVQKQYIEGKVPSTSSTMSLSQGANVAGATIKAVSEFIKMIPIVGTVISGLLNISANVIDAAVKGTAGSSSQLQDPEKFKEAVREVVRSENNRQTAEDAASTFMNATTYLANLDPTDLGPHELEDLKQNTEDFCAPGREPLNHLTSMNLNVDKAKHVTSAYLLGISAYLRFLWFHFLIAVNDGDAITAHKLKGVRDSIQLCLDGVTNLRSEAVAHVEQTVSSTGVRVQPEVSQLRQALYTAFLGLSDVAALDAAIGNLKDVVRALNDDMDLATRGQRTRYYFKTNWGLPAVGAQPVTVIVGAPPTLPQQPVPPSVPGRPVPGRPGLGGSGRDS